MVCFLFKNKISDVQCQQLEQRQLQYQPEAE